MKNIVSIALVLVLGGCATIGSQSKLPDAAAIDTEAARLMKRESVQGMALAVIDHGKISYVAAYGHRDEARSLPLTTNSIMYGASLTKTAFTYMLLQLVDEGRLDLDTSVADLLPQPLPKYNSEDYNYTDLVGDERWRKLTPRILLSHTSGFANFRWLEPDKRLRFHSTPGTRYGYSGEGFYILQLILEQGLGLDVGKEMQTRIFNRFGMTDTSMTWRPDFSTKLADGFKLDGSTVPHDERSSVSAAGSMDTTIADQARLWSGIVRGEGLSRASRAAMITPQISISSAHEFPSLASETNPENRRIGLAAGLGLVTFQGRDGRAWFKGGHNDWTGNMVVCIENNKRCLVLLGNDVRAERIYPEMTRFILGETEMPWTWDYEWLGSEQEKDL